MPSNQLIVLMGPAGCGKSTIGAALSSKTGWPLIEGDDYHPDANVKKMTQNVALNDDDRVAWLDALMTAISSYENDRLILACSALTPYVQSRLREDSGRAVKFILLDVPKAMLAERLNNRSGHFMSASLLDSQLNDLTLPANAIQLTGNAPINQVIKSALAALDP